MLAIKVMGAIAGGHWPVSLSILLLSNKETPAPYSRRMGGSRAVMDLCNREQISFPC